MTTRARRAAIASAALAAGAGAGVALAASGGLDPSFGTGGVTVLSHPTSTHPTPAAIAPGEKIVVVSSDNVGITVSRLLPDGSPDPTFDGDGIAGIVSSDRLNAEDVAVQPDGRIVIAGVRHGMAIQDGMVWRLKPDGGSGATNGALDPSFGTDGAVNLDTGGSDRALALTIQPDGRIVVAGQSFTSPDPNVAVVWRLTTGGGLDSSFDTDGVAAVSDGSDDNAEAVALQPDGKIVIAGSTNLPPNPRNAIVWRLKADGGAGALNGALDPTFDTDGQANLDGGGDDIADGVAVQPDGKIVIAGVAQGSAAVWRLLSGGGPGATNGALDPSFDADGAAEIDGGGFASAGAVALQPDGKILVVGSAKATGSPFVAAVWRLAANGGSGAVNGALDPSFGVAGVATVSDSFGAGALALQPDRRIVVAGATSDAQLLAFRVLGDPFALNVATAGTGSGSVQSAPAGIACPASCSGTFDDGVGVALTATAATGSQFTGWSGAGCSGSGACMVSMTSDRTVTATFDAAQPQSKHFVLKASMLSMRRFRRSARKARALVNGLPPGTRVSAKLLAGRRALAKATKTAGAAGRARLTFRFSRRSRKRLHSRKLKGVRFAATATPRGDTSSKASKRVGLKR